ncbi:hypothetical protein RS130_12655 [Paraglaciecola aquimarina]|uniref:Uncharacterized protein n=1 Tax=Paraglaciecola aquimarina TaxID=1235557 RepID=A0ABU3SXC2_9ALTE|nr:hypothetical protein [Paraglaciecola aquimarina]MDU0354654.1 hypothetical protein [Paraglaciecola aquimarina]
MQPTQRFKKTLLASTLIIGAGITSTASAETFTITASGIPDVVAAPVTGFETVEFGATIKGSQIGGSCKIYGATTFSDSDMAHDLDQDGADDTLDPGAGEIFGSVYPGTTGACNKDTAGQASGAAAIIEIDGVPNSTVSISIPTVSGTGWTYSPSDESCYVNYGGDSSVDPCTSLASGSATGVAMAAAYGTETDGTNADDYDTIIEGKVRMILAGELTIEAPGIAQGTPVADNIVVTVVYE